MASRTVACCFEGVGFGEAIAVRSPSCVQLFMTPWIAVCQGSLSLTISWSLPKFMSIELVMSIESVRSNTELLIQTYYLLVIIYPAGFLINDRHPCSSSSTSWTPLIHKQLSWLSSHVPHLSLFSYAAWSLWLIHLFHHWSNSPSIACIWKNPALEEHGHLHQAAASFLKPFFPSPSRFNPSPVHSSAKRVLQSITFFFSHYCPQSLSHCYLF